MSQGTMVVYRCAPDVVWVKDAAQTILVMGETGRSWHLTGWKAAVWDLLSLGYLADDIVHFLSVLLNLPAETAGTRLLMVLDEWERDGVVHGAAEDRRG